LYGLVGKACIVLMLSKVIMAVGRSE